LLRSKRVKTLIDLRKQRKKPVAQTFLRGNFLLNNNSNVIHYVRADCRMKSLGADASKIDFPAQFSRYEKCDVIALLAPPDEPTDDADDELRAYGSRRKTATVSPTPTPTPTPICTPTPTPTLTPTPTSTPATRSARTATGRSARKVIAMPAAGDIPTHRKHAQRPRLAQGQIVMIAEKLAYERMQAGDITATLRILWSGIRMGRKKLARGITTGKPTYRLLDFVAFVALRHGQSEELTKLIRFAMKDNLMTKALSDRVYKWTEWLQKPDDSAAKWSASRVKAKQSWTLPKNYM
jgi:hypothetical protein